MHSRVVAGAERKALLPELPAIAKAALLTDEGSKATLVDAREVEFAGGARIVVALVASGMHCIFGVVDPRSWRAENVRITDFPGCKRIQFVAEDDFNADGIPDFQYRLMIASNRYPVDVDESVVLLSQPAGLSYCYAEQLSVLGDARSAVARLGKAALRCYGSQVD
ncbi:MAG TPA: hypothetical protein VMI54_01520 [Polyangiaceae bacterium]|nr:hypothetical protein [Polyangiaceae bacterium]